MVFFIISSFYSWIAPLAVLKSRQKAGFFILLISGFIFQLFTASLAGRMVHRDFLTYPAQIILLYLIILIIKFDHFSLLKRRTLNYRVISNYVLVLAILWYVWLLMMFYAIVTRAEPRWLESSGYNLINAIIGLVLFGAVIWIRERATRSVSIKDSTVFLDEQDLSEILSPQEISIIIAFLNSPNHSLNCKDLYMELKAMGREGGDKNLPCTRCLDESWTATSCSVYRNYKNRIQDTKKYLELIQIGTLVPVSENPREIKVSGWLLRFFDDVSLETPKKQKIDRLFEHVRQ